MGYESRIYAVKGFEGTNASETIAVVNLCKIGDELNELKMCFDTEIDFGVFDNAFDDFTKVDRYGERLKYASDKERLLQCVRTFDVREYWRFELLIKFVEMFRYCDNVKLVHFGY